MRENHSRMLRLDPEDFGEIEIFAREILGCGCPDDVFRDISVENDPDSFEGLPVEFLIKIGGRLMVGVVPLSQTDEALPLLRQLLETGRDLRDREGFNRFRLVFISDDPEKMQKSIEKKLNGFSGLDDRIHAHAVRPGSLPHCCK